MNGRNNIKIFVELEICCTIVIHDCSHWATMSKFNDWDWNQLNLPIMNQQTDLTKEIKLQILIHQQQQARKQTNKRANTPVACKFYIKIDYLILILWVTKAMIATGLCDARRNHKLKSFVKYKLSYNCDDCVTMASAWRWLFYLTMVARWCWLRLSRTTTTTNLLGEIAVNNGCCRRRLVPFYGTTSSIDRSIDADVMHHLQSRRSGRAQPEVNNSIVGGQTCVTMLMFIKLIGPSAMAIQ